MSEQSAGDLISVPQGGGALSGLGEKFQPDLHTGTGNFAIPLDLPTGRGAMRPTLSLTYSTGNPNGPFGMGWALSVPGVRRRTSKSVPTYDDAGDTFVLSGAEDLVEVPSSDAHRRYRPRTESGYARISHVSDGTGDYWEVWSAGGLRSRYGTPAPAATGGWHDPAVVTDPQGRIFGWLLTETVDLLGNRVVYSWIADPHGTAQRYLGEIRYADYGDPADPSYLVSIRFSYADRPDPFSDRRPGFELRTTQRATAIETWMQAPTPVLAKSVRLTYADEAGIAPVGGVSLLTSVRTTGHDGDATQDRPPLELGYQDWEPDQRVFQTLGGDLPAGSLGTPGLDLVDLFGDGLPSFLELNGTARYWRNRGDGRLDPPRSLAAAPAGVGLGSPGVLLADLDGDGRPEIVVSNATSTTSWPLADAEETPGAGDRAGFDGRRRVSGAAPSFGLADPLTRLVDLDGDGRMDLLRSGERFLAAYNDGAGGFTGLRPLAGHDAPPVSFADPRVRLADMTGDGLTDIVLLHDGAVSYWPNLGYGRFGARVAMTGAPRFADGAHYDVTGFDPHRLLLGDVLGDGAADLVYVGDGHVTVWANQSGNGFAQPVVVPGTPRVSDASSIRLTDLFGTGCAGVLWTAPAGQRRDRYAFLDLTGGAKPYLLTTVDNHAGARTEITYSTSTAYAAADRAAGRPWRTPLPFPVHVVSAVAVTDAFSGSTLTTSYAYHHGYWDGADREFRGFARVEQADTLSRPAPPGPAAGTATPIDPLAPRQPVPHGLDVAAHGNVLANWSFDVASGQPAPPGPTKNGGPSAARGWQVRQTGATTVTTELVASTLPYGHGGRSMHVTTTVPHAGVGQRVALLDSAVASAWVYVVRGAVALACGPAAGAVDVVTCRTTGRWVLLEARVPGPAQQLVIRSVGASGAEFHVDHVWLRRGDALPAAGVPTRTTTWFHVGPVGPETGGWTELDLSDEWWQEDRPLAAATDLSPAPADLPRRALRDAVRSLRGQVLRREVYADDGSPLSDRPYDVATTSYAVRPVLDGRAGNDPDWQAAPVFATQATVAVASTWERGTEPMTRIHVAAPPDAYGRTPAEVEIAVPRGRDPRVPAEAGAPYLARLTTTSYATRDDATGYLVDRASITRSVEVDNDGSLAALALAAQAIVGETSGAVRALHVTRYDGAAYDGLPPGQLGTYGLAARTESLVLTPEILTAASRPGDGTGLPADPPSYLPADGSAAAAGSGYPAGFAAALVPSAGYVWHDDADGYVAGYYAQTSRLAYDVQSGAGRGLVTAHRDAMGADTLVTYDEYDLLPVTVTDPVGLSRSATYDYRVLRVASLTDPNGNVTEVGYTPLGLPAWTAALGKPGGTQGNSEGDTREQPATRYEYGLTAWDDSAGGTRQPMWVRTTRRVDHRWTLVARENAARAAVGGQPMTDAEIAAMFPDDEATRYPERFVRRQEFSDGLGRLLQARVQSDDVTVTDLGITTDPRKAAKGVTATDATAVGQVPVVVSGWKVYDGKGRVVTEYEPFFDSGYDYVPPDATRLAGLAKLTTGYDPRGLAVVVTAPDGSQSVTVPGVPDDLRDPTRYRPTPWESYSYDASDNAGRTVPTTSLAWATHWATPSSSVLDALGRAVQHTERLGDTEVTITSRYDSDGNVLEVTDPLDRRSAASVFDLAKRPWRNWLLDAGAVRSVHDASGGVVEQRDDKGAVVLTAFDRAHRPTRQWMADGAGQTATLRTVTGYGDDPDSGLTADDAKARNAFGRPVRSCDEAGLLDVHRYDLDGNPVSRARQVLRADVLLSGLPSAGGDWAATAYRVDWEPAAGQSAADRASSLVDPTTYDSDAVFDALGRRTALTCPKDVTGARAVLRFEYGNGGGIARLLLDDEVYVDRVCYDAQGRRTLVVLGNGIITRRLHDPRSSRLVRLRTERAAAVGALSWRAAASAGVLQDAHYRHDQVGNVVLLADRAPGAGVGTSPDALDRMLAYDPLSRLVSATGRETDAPPSQPWLDAPRSVDATRAVGYAESYAYDVVGNLTGMTHHGSVDYTRAYAAVDGSDRVASLTTGGTTVPYAYDAVGNLTAEATSRRFEWDHDNRCVTFREQADGADPSTYAQYRYDAGGTRVLKVVRDQGGGLQVTVYVEGFFERLVVSRPSGSTTHDSIHVLDTSGRVAIVRKGDPPPDVTSPAVCYHLGDHLGSSNVVVDGAGALVNREEYSPYGETTFGSYDHKRYRFTGKERDEETGLSYHGSRYYAPWLARWISCDPAGHVDGACLYTYARGNPMRLTDPTGKWSYDPAAAADHVDAAIDQGEKMALAEDTGLASSLYNTVVATTATVAKGFTSILRVGTGAARGYNEITHAQDGWDVAIGACRILSDAGEVASAALGAAGTASKGLRLAKDVQLAREIRVTAEAREVATGADARRLSEQLGELHTDRLANKAGLEAHDARILSKEGAPTRHGVDRALSGKAPFSKRVNAVVEAKGTGSIPSDPTKLLKTYKGALTQGSAAYNASRLGQALTSGSPGAATFTQLLTETGGQPASYLVAADASGASSVFELQGATGIPTATPAAGLPSVPTDNIMIGVGALSGTAAGARSQ